MLSQASLCLGRDTGNPWWDTGAVDGSAQLHSSLSKKSSRKEGTLVWCLVITESPSGLKHTMLRSKSELFLLTLCLFQAIPRATLAHFPEQCNVAAVNKMPQIPEQRKHWERFCHYLTFYFVHLHFWHWQFFEDIYFYVKTKPHKAIRTEVN